MIEDMHNNLQYEIQVEYYAYLRVKKERGNIPQTPS